MRSVGKALFAAFPLKRSRPVQAQPLSLHERAVGMAKRASRWHVGVPVAVLIAGVVGGLATVPGLSAPAPLAAIQRDRIVLRFDRPITAASSFVVANPRRLVLDLGGVRPGGQVETDGPVDAIRQTLRVSATGAGTTRIVFDLTRPALLEPDAVAAGRRELTFRLRTVDASTFARAVAGPPQRHAITAQSDVRIAPATRVRATPVAIPVAVPSARPAAIATTTLLAKPARRNAVAIPLPPIARSGRMPRIYGDDDRRPLVVIDAGHGGVDPGAISPIDGRREKDVTLKIARAIRDELVRAGRVRVALTREDDRFLILRERYGIARRLGGDLFISIHCDSVGAGSATGASVYTLSEVASDKESARLAARENKSDIIAGVNLASTNADISSILIDLTQRETMNASAAFARLLGREARERVPLKPSFHRMASLMVLKAPDMPSVLFETGYISNPVDADFIDSDDGRQRIAESVERAVEVYFARRMAAR